jgi:hypothetical protein
MAATSVIETVLWRSLRQFLFTSPHTYANASFLIAEALKPHRPRCHDCLSPQMREVVSHHFTAIFCTVVRGEIALYDWVASQSVSPGLCI